MEECGHSRVEESSPELTVGYRRAEWRYASGQSALLLPGFQESNQTFT